MVAASVWIQPSAAVVGLVGDVGECLPWLGGQALGRGEGQ